MSVVRKYQTGGSTPNQNEYSDFENFLAEKINREANNRMFTEKGEKALRNQASLWMENAKKGLFDTDDQGNFKHYKIDKIKNTYSLNPGENKELNIALLQGNSDQIKPNLFGKFGLDEKKANTWVANARLEYDALKGKTGTNTPAHTKTKIKFGPLEEYMQDIVYNGNENWLSAWEDGNEGLDDRTVQRKIAENMKGYIEWHNKKVGSNDEYLEYQAIDGEQDLLGVSTKLLGEEFTPEDYRKFKDVGYRYGTDFGSLWSPKTPEQIQSEKDVETKKQSDAYLQKLITDGISPDIAKVIAGNNLKIGQLPETVPQYVRDHVAEQEGLVLDMPNGKQQVWTKDGNLLPSYDFNDPDNNYATYYINDEKGFNYFAPGTKGYNGTNFKDPITSGLDLRPIKGNIQGFEGWNIFGIPTKISGKGNDYIKHLHLKDPNSDNVIDLYQKQDTTGIYTDKNGKEYNGDITEFGEYTAGNLPVSLNMPTVSKEYDVLPAIEDENVSFDENLDIGKTTIDKVRQTLSALKYIIDHPEKYSDFDTREAASIRYMELVNKLDNPKLQNIKKQILNAKGDQSTAVGSTVPNTMSNTLSRMKITSIPSGRYKEGGILKYQAGAKAKKLTPEEYAAIYAPAHKTTAKSNIPKQTGIRDITGSLKDATAADMISLGGSALSIVPGLGAIGGAVTTVADAYRDASDGDWTWGDTGNLAMNLGFTGLALVGFGGVGTAAKAAKLAKLADKTSDVTKIAVQGIDDVAKLSKPLQEGLEKLATGQVKTFKAAGITKTELSELKLLHPDLGKITSTTTVVPKSFLNKITKVAEPVTGPTAVSKVIRNPNMLEREFSGSIKLAKAIAGKTNLSAIGKGAAMGLGGLGALNAGHSAISALSQYAEGGLENVQVNDLKNSMFLASGIRGAMKSRQVGNLAKKVNPSTEGDQLLTIGKQTYAIDKAVKDPKLIQEQIEKLQTLKKLRENTRIRVDSKNNVKRIADNKESVKEYKEALSKLIGKEVHDDLALSLMGKKVAVKGANQSASDLGVSQLEYDRAIKMANGEMNYWMPSWWKKGGVLKAGGGLKLSYDKNISKSYQYDKSYLDYVFGLDQKWLDDNTAGLQKAVGPNYKIENLEHLKYLGTDNMYGPVHKYLDNNYQNSSAGNQTGEATGTTTTTAVPVGAGVGVGTGSVASTVGVTDAVTGAANTGNGTGAFVDNGSNGIGSRWKLPLNIDKNDLYNLAGYLGANTATNKSILLQKKAALEGIVNLPYQSRQYFRQTSPNAAFAEREANKVTGMAGRMASATSDYNQGANVMLAGANKAAEYRVKGDLLDREQANKTIGAQMQSDRQTDTYNLQVNGKNKASSADAASKMFMYDAAGVVAKNQNMQNYLMQLNRSDIIKRQEAKYKNYYDLAMSDEPQKLYTQMQDLDAEELTAKEAWQKANESAIGKGEPLDWTKDDKAKYYASQRKNIQGILQRHQMKVYGANLAMQMPGSIGYNAKGGTLEEKKELIRYRHELNSKSKQTENFYKVILKNNELMLKSLSRIFK